MNGIKIYSSRKGTKCVLKQTTKQSRVCYQSVQRIDKKKNTSEGISAEYLFSTIIFLEII